MEINGDSKLGDADIIRQGVQSLLRCLRNECNNMESISPSIYMVPGVIRDLSASSFGPRVVSIGPLHREDKNVQAFEKQKPRFLFNLMSRIKSPEDKILESCMQKAHASMEQIKACYDWTKTYNDAEVAKMMVMDACFILEFIYWISESDKSYPGNNLNPITVMPDLVLLENQIPFFFLNEIYECTVMKNHPRFSLIQFLYPLLINLSIFKEDTTRHNTSVNTTHHILSLLHQCYKPQQNIQPAYFAVPNIYSAIDLDRAGVSFKPYKDPTPTWVMEMKVKSYRFLCFFGSWGKPTLRMPVLIIKDATELILRNLIAYEQSGQTCNHITSYVWAMDMLVNTKEDVAKLVNSGVLDNQMSSNEEAASIINSLGNELVCKEFYYKKEWEALYQYCDGYWPKHIVRLRRSYFNSPWSIIALFAGIILFTLSVVQTIFTIKSTNK